MWKQTKTCLLLFLMLSILTGVIYPAAITGLAQLVFPSQASGSLIRKNGKVIGSRLIGQQFEEPKYFWGRPSATAPPYNASASSGSNLGPGNPKLKNSVLARLKKLQDADPTNHLPVPVDLVTASGSGLDPHISIAAANYQKSRVARARGISDTKVEELIRRYTTGRFLGFLGEPVVNVLQLNLALDGFES
jgi:K+-transporting ATPase ATPase C chain